MAEPTGSKFLLPVQPRSLRVGHAGEDDHRGEQTTRTYVNTKNKVVDPTRSVAAVDTGMYLVGLNLFPALLGIL